MKILAVSDRVVNLIYSEQIRSLYGDVDMIIGCGDLPYYYLEYIVTMLPVPGIYVYGNHDKTQYTIDGRTVDRAEGCTLIDGKTWEKDGVLFAGLGGSMRYQPDAINQYTEAEMRWRILRLLPGLIRNRIKYGRWLDVLVTHSPPLGIHDGEDLTHTGFKSLLRFLKWFTPKYMLHGHMHRYRRDVSYETQYLNTKVVNVYPKRVIEFEP